MYIEQIISLEKYKQTQIILLQISLRYNKINLPNNKRIILHKIMCVFTGKNTGALCGIHMLFGDSWGYALFGVASAEDFFVLWR